MLNRHVDVAPSFDVLRAPTEIGDLFVKVRKVYHVVIGVAVVIQWLRPSGFLGQLLVLASLSIQIPIIPAMLIE